MEDQNQTNFRNFLTALKQTIDTEIAKGEKPDGAMEVYSHELVRYKRLYAPKP